jgi:hypothetical protein
VAGSKAGGSFRCGRRDDRRNQGYGDNCCQSERANHLASIKSGERRRLNQLPSEQIVIRELVEGQPDNSLIYYRVRFVTQQPGNVAWGVLTVAPLPDKGGSFIQTMRLIALNIVDQNFMR